jgi:1,4-alpha-glucan branching enzyme
MSRGYLSLILHAHLPFARHPEREGSLEERWFFEAVAETYLPLARALERLLDDGVAFRLTVSISPTLASMMRDPLLQERCSHHLAGLLELAEKEVHRTRDDERFHHVANMYRDLFAENLDTFENRYGRDLVAAFARFQEAGAIEIMTCAATHGFLPLLRPVPSAVRAQVLVAADSHRAHFGRPARGIWLPECGYYPGVEDVLKEAGFRFFIVDSHGVANASIRPHYGLQAPIACPNGVAAFPRDPDSSKQVWSAREGYPGDTDYREYYRDIGFDLDFDYVKPHVLDGRVRVNTGVKYFRITGPSDWKEPYQPDWAREKAAIHAGNFMFWRQKQIEYHTAHMGRAPLIVAPFDAELFGHWWFEGPQWLEFLVRKIVFDQDSIALATPSDYLEKRPSLQKSIPSASSWGEKGYNEYWLNGANDWVYPHVHRAARRMNELADDRAAGALSLGGKGDALLERALKQAARSILLAQASDWPFIMKAGTTVDLAQRRVRDLLGRFHLLERGIEEGKIDERELEALEWMDRIFPEIDVGHFASNGGTRDSGTARGESVASRS